MAQPQFWLRVRKEYVMDNFDSLMTYMRKYVYELPDATGTGADNSDFDDSLRCMEEVADELFETIDATPFFEPVKIDYSPDSVLRLLCGIVLAARKTGRVHHKSILRIASLVMRENPKRGTESKLTNIIKACGRGESLLNLSLTWADVESADKFLHGVFVDKFLRTSFLNSDPEGPVVYREHNGLVMFPPQGPMLIAGMNLDSYLREGKRQMAVQLSAHESVDFLVAKSAFEKLKDFHAVQRVALNLQGVVSRFAASTPRRLKTYEQTDPIKVQVIDKSGVRIVARTIDPNYEPVEGKVAIEPRNPAKRIDFYTIASHIKVGDYLEVNLSNRPEFAFELADEFEHYYRNYAAECYNGVYSAVLVSTFRDGEEWLTDEGVRVGVHKDALRKLSPKALAEYEYACGYNRPIYLQFYSERPDTTGTEFFMYAIPGDGEGNMYPEDSSLTREQAYASFMNYYLDEMRSEAEHLLKSSEQGTYLPTLSADAVEALALQLFCLSRWGGGSSLERLQTLYIAQLLTTMEGRTRDAAFLQVQCGYLVETLRFAANEKMEPFAIPAEFADNEGLSRQRAIVETLRSYRRKNDDPTDVASTDISENDTLLAVKKLVEASNSLADIIDITELNNIKQTITRVLGVEDEFESILDSRTYYGAESINLEFKSSVVFAPANRRRYAGYSPEPDNQKWAIIKAVCGFLNSRSGGELLIGVNDAGYAVGLDDDFRALAQMKRISYPDLDHYRNYIQSMLDIAFCKLNGPRTPTTDISHTSITIEGETNAERRTILRVKVTPFPKEVVGIVDENRPWYIKDSYVRDTGRTVELTETLRTTVERYKKSV